MKNLSIIGLLLLLPITAFAQGYCSGPSCGNTTCLSADANCSGGVDLPDADVNFGYAMEAVALRQSTFAGTLSDERMQCFAQCRRDYTSNLQLCLASTTGGPDLPGMTPSGTGQDLEAACREAAREKYIECLGITSFMDCMQ
ncbi:MAG: hypothetical protein AAFR74_06750 [Pseudomonadota bacterium]